MADAAAILDEAEVRARWASFSWSEELTRFLLVWLSMLGAAVLLRRDDHIRLNLLDDHIGPKGQLWLSLVLRLLVLGFLFILVQQAENNILQPLVQKKTVEIPPVLLIVVLFAMGQIFGVPGILVATPLLAIVLVIVRRIYVERILEGSGDAEPETVAAPPRARDMAEGAGAR